MKTNDKTLADVAEEWWAEQGRMVPPRDTPEYQAMYEEWASFAFADFRESLANEKG